jgi:hypothetical protein
MGGRPPKPLKLLQLTGADRKNPKRFKNRGEELKSPPIGGPPQEWMIFHPDTGYQRAERLRKLWDHCLGMWGQWLEFADRDALVDYIEYRDRMKNGPPLKGIEITTMNKIRTDLGGTGSGRAKRGMLNAPRGDQGAKKAEDPRAAYLARKTG